uniref:Nucleoporin 50 n=1 Tax=Astyanax mexicanus TaxID=7994 RepID=A0A8B9RMR2_ASTMX
MAKRIAEKELTDRNWDQEDEGEEAGTFSTASEDVMKNRAIKKAKRRNFGAEGESGGAFKSFKGFSLTASAPAAGGGGGFTGFGNGTGFKPLSGLTNGSMSSVTPSFGGFSSSATPKPITGSLSFNGPASSKPADSDITSNGSAPSLAVTLNCSVRDWITKHVNDNPLCDLNPIFRDYERHLASIEKKYGSCSTAADSKHEKPAAAAAAAAPPQPPSPALFSFTKDKDNAAREKSSAPASAPVPAPVPAGVTFNFGKKLDSSMLGSLTSGGTSGFSPFSSSSSSSSSSTSLFGGAASTGTSSSTFSFTAAKTETASNSQTAGTHIWIYIHTGWNFIQISSCNTPSNDPQSLTDSVNDVYIIIRNIRHIYCLY